MSQHLEKHTDLWDWQVIPDRELEVDIALKDHKFLSTVATHQEIMVARWRS